MGNLHSLYSAQRNLWNGNIQHARAPIALENLSAKQPLDAQAWVCVSRFIKFHFDDEKAEFKVNCYYIYPDNSARNSAVLFRGPDTIVLIRALYAPYKDLPVNCQEAVNVSSFKKEYKERRYLFGELRISNDVDAKCVPRAGWKECAVYDSCSSWNFKDLLVAVAVNVPGNSPFENTEDVASCAFISRALLIALRLQYK